MLVEFCVGNYRSFNETVTFSMEAANIKSQDKALDANNVFDAGRKLRLLTSAAIYGANASGKSNLLRAIRVMRTMVLHSSEGTQQTGGILVERFRLSTATAGKPSFFQVTFLVDGRRYRYGFEATSERIETEWLYWIPKTTEARLFERRGDEFEFGDGFREGKDLADKVRPNALMLSVAAQFNSSVARPVVEWFQQRLIVTSGLDDEDLRITTLLAMQQPDRRSAVIDLLRKLDLGFRSMRLERPAQGFRSKLTLPSGAPPEIREALEAVEHALEIVTSAASGEFESVLSSVKLTHPVYDSEGREVTVEEFDLKDDESEGTQKLFAWMGSLEGVLREGQVFVIDEFDARLHPLISQAIIRLFNSPETNPKHAQLIFATHDTNLLNRRYFRRDQIWFTEKDRQGATRLYSLAEFKLERHGVRNDASFELDYIRGKYGAIPYLSDFERLPLGAATTEAN
jgi:uncharacterized protein